MNQQQDLTLYSWFAGEDDRAWAAHNPHLAYSDAHDIEHSAFQRKMFDERKYNMCSILAGDFLPVEILRIFGNPAQVQEKWDHACIDTYCKLFPDSGRYIKSFDKCYEAECGLDCDRCGDELTILNRSPNSGLCDECNATFDDDEDFQL